MPGGRPTKLTPELTEKICESIRAGVYMETAAAIAGIVKSTLYGWLRRAERARIKKDGTPYAKDLPYVEFSNALQKAAADAIARDLAVIDRAAQGGATRKVTKRKYERGVAKDGADVRVLVEEMIEESEALPQWQAAAWRLERRNPEQFGRRVPREIEPEEIDLDELTDDELDRITGGENIEAVVSDASRRLASEATASGDAE